MLTNELASLSQSQQSTICRAASAMVQAAVQGSDPHDQVSQLGELAELPIEGVFVTVKRGQTLRGCCGRQGQTASLGPGLADAAARTARDPRMAPLSASELPYLNLSVSLLGPLRNLEAIGDDRAAAVQVGEHGLRISMGQNGGLLLPQVAIEQGWNANQFLDGVCSKAGLPAGAWRSDDAELQLFDGVYFDSEFQCDDSLRPPEKMFLSPQERQSCCDWIRNNCVALLTGATPVYYPPGVSDAEVLGLVLSINHPRCGSQQWLQLSLKSTRPMQSSLFQMTGQAVTWLHERVCAGDAVEAESIARECHVKIAVLGDCVHHGKATDADLRGLEVGGRAVVLTDGRRWSVVFKDGCEAAELIDLARDLESFRGGEQLYSMHCDCSSDSMAVSVGPRADSAIRTRPPAVAGSFYPADDESREAAVDGLLDGLPPCEKQPVFAVMVPHAGLRYSGRIAADVWRRIEVPSRVLVIGPKHTNDGVDWAVAPHDNWQLSPTAAISGDQELAEELAAQIPGMELDAKAHAREHGIEVQLPLMLRFCPDTKLAAIAMSGGDPDQLAETATALADWIRDQDDPPLLVVSSDMNHFADDQENRRRDRLALDALATGDGKELLSVCRRESISMCGQVPAALVMMVMDQLGKQAKAVEIGYATSADCGADKDRVVGYAGVIWNA
ncbi:AmmeMemoRadiSam system protein B [Stieleria sp. TO1_6]|uniref:AmmeMemoRadiSam system protein B n=1 Tax=Stieleria tagensis TaxID=2956795 RepID=UPI00209B856E|nr:AmmeMemoRadiSam system protein B [Stieleria tagensis]MCO8125488.1 AmmeMemoRadiSam system protein B [Stieleria tagensis]